MTGFPLKLKVRYLLLGAAECLLHGADLALRRQRLLHLVLVAASAGQVSGGGVAAGAVAGGQAVCQLHAGLSAGDDRQDGGALHTCVCMCTCVVRGSWMTRGKQTLPKRNMSKGMRNEMRKTVSKRVQRRSLVIFRVCFTKEKFNHIKK